MRQIKPLGKYKRGWSEPRYVDDSPMFGAPSRTMKHSFNGRTLTTRRRSHEANQSACATHQQTNKKKTIQTTRRHNRAMASDKTWHCILVLCTQTYKNLKSYISWDCQNVFQILISWTQIFTLVCTAVPWDRSDPFSCWMLSNSAKNRWQANEQKLLSTIRIYSISSA